MPKRDLGLSACSPERLESSVQRTEKGIEPRWPSTLFWWCTTCGEPSEGDPCQFCGNPITRYKVVLADA